MEDEYFLNLPPHWQTYYADIKDRCKNLITARIWNGIDINRLNAWLKNFDTDDEKYLSACVLDSLMYRSNSKTKALIYHLFNIVLPNYTRLNPTPIGQINDWIERLQSTSQDPGVRLVAAVSDDDPPTKSSHLVLRLLSKEFQIEEGWIIYPHKLKYHFQSGIRTFIFIDDFLGSGDQFNELILEYDLHNFEEKNREQTYFLYCPLVAHERGIKNISETFNGKIPVVASENLKEEMNFFEIYFESEANNARKFYIQMLKKRNIHLSREDDYFGHGNLQLGYSFEHACPDNALKILWLNKNWTPLFDR